MQWERASDKATSLETMSGWYWTWRPKQLGRQSYDASRGVLCLVFVEGGELVSPLADFRTIADGLACKDVPSGTLYDTWLAGPVKPGELSAMVRAEVLDDSVQAKVSGEAPESPGWWWCKTNPEAPLLLVDHNQIGPVFLEEDADAVVRVFLAVDAQGRSVDVGEFGFSEPLVSRGGVIDDSGELGRTEAEFYGAVQSPPPLPEEFPKLG